MQFFIGRYFFNKIYSNYNYKIVGLSALFEIRQNLPKFFLEFLAVVFISASIFFLLSKDYSPSEIFPIISVFAAGLIKAIPSTSKLLSSIQRMKSNEHVVNTIYDEVIKFKKNTRNLNSLKTFEKDNSDLPGHPVKNDNFGIDFSTGSLGMGLSLAAGVAVALKKKNID